MSIEDVIARDLHSLLYLEEFTFARNKFSPPGGSELELADAVLVLGDALVVFQIKERSTAHSGDAKQELSWFAKQVEKDAKEQIKGTLSYLLAFDSIVVANERGRTFNLAAGGYRNIVKVIVYRGGANLPIDSLPKFRKSQSAGFIHLISFDDYVQMAGFLRVPEEILRYLDYREACLKNFQADCGALPEASFVGGFVGENAPPRYKSYLNLHRAIDDEETWNLIPMLRTLRDNYTHPDHNADYYEILSEFIRLPRSAWRDAKERIRLCIDKVAADEFAKPYRFAFPGRDIGFVFVPTTSDLWDDPDWDTIKVQGLVNLTAHHKFDQRLSRCIGVMVSKAGDMFDIQWCKIEHEWEDDPELRARLDANFPFRPVSEKLRFGYFLAN